MLSRDDTPENRRRAVTHWLEVSSALFDPMKSVSPMLDSWADELSKESPGAAKAHKREMTWQIRIITAFTQRSSLNT